MLTVRNKFRSQIELVVSARADCSFCSLFAVDKEFKIFNVDFCCCSTVNVEYTLYKFTVERIEQVYLSHWRILVQLNVAAYVCNVVCSVLSGKFNIVESVVERRHID